MKRELEKVFFEMFINLFNLMVYIKKEEWLIKNYFNFIGFIDFGY